MMRTQCTFPFVLFFPVSLCVSHPKSILSASEWLLLSRSVRGNNRFQFCSPLRFIGQRNYRQEDIKHDTDRNSTKYSCSVSERLPCFVWDEKQRRSLPCFWWLWKGWWSWIPLFFLLGSVVVSSVVLSLTGLLFVSFSPNSLWFHFLILFFRSNELVSLQFSFCTDDVYCDLSPCTFFLSSHFGQRLRRRGRQESRWDQRHTCCWSNHHFHVQSTEDTSLMSLVTLLLCFKSYFYFRSVWSLRRRFQQFFFFFEMHSADTVQVKVWFSTPPETRMNYLIHGPEEEYYFPSHPRKLQVYFCLKSLTDPLFFSLLLQCTQVSSLS